MSRRRSVLPLAAVLVVPLLAGCGGSAVAGPGLGGFGAAVCASWVGYEDDQAMHDEAVLVVVGVADPAEGRLDFLTGPGERHRVAVEAVLKGELDAGELLAGSPRDYCIEDPPWPAADPIPTGERVVLFLRPFTSGVSAAPVPDDLDDVESWGTMTPMAGVLPLPDGAELSFEPEHPLG